MAPMGIDGDRYVLTPEQIKFWKDNGYVHLPQVLTEEEIKQVEPVYNKFIFGEVPDAAKNTSDITGGANEGQKIENYAGIIVVNPSEFSPELKSHVFPRRAKHIAEQLGNAPQTMEMDRFLAKKPKALKAEFKWHQDEIYLKDSSGQTVEFPKYETLILFVELDDTTEDNGCVRYVVGSHKEDGLREHSLSHPDVKPTTITVSETKVDETKENCVAVPVKRGDMVIHNDHTLHRSAGNRSDNWRRTWVVHFCPTAIAEERERRGVTQSLHEKGMVVHEDA